MTIESLKRFSRPLMMWYCWKKGLGYKLTYVTLSLTFRCNLRCIMCPIWRAGERGNNPDYYNELSTDRLLSLMDELKKLDTGHLHFTGGEPLLRKDLFEILRHGKELGMSFSVNTNGTLISRNIAEKLIDSGVQKVIFSIDSPNPEIHDEIRGRKGAWRKAIEGMTNLDIVRKELDSPSKITIVTVLMSLNYKTVDEIMDFKRVVDFDELTFAPVVDPKRTPKVASLWTKEELEQNLELTMDDIGYYNREIAPKVHDKAKKYGFEVDPVKWAYPFGKTQEDVMKFVESGRSRDLYKKLFCFKPWFSMEIYPDGDVAPCCVAPLFGEKYVMGNLKENSLLRIWNGEKYIQFRRKCKPPSFSMCNFCSIHDRKVNQAYMEKYQRIRDIRTMFSGLRKI